MGSSGGDRVDGSREAVTRALRESRASRFFAMVDGEPREVKAAKTRGRWERLHDSAVAMGATAIECRDDGGAVLAFVELEELGAELVEERVDAFDGPKRARDTSTAGEVERLLSIVLRAQDAAVQRQAEHVQSVTSAALSVMNAAAERAASMERAVLALVQQRERELDAAAAQLDAEARAIARARKKPAESEEDDTMSELDKIGTQLVRDAVMPAVMPKIAAALANAGKGS